MRTLRLEVTGMTCAHCAETVENAVLSVGGVEAVEVRYAQGTGEARVGEGTAPGDVIAAVEAAGYGARVAAEASADPAAGIRPSGGGKARGEDAGFDLLVIGTGSAGMAAAIRGAELGRRVAIVEAGEVGGTCVNVGCVPSKNLIAVAAHYRAVRDGFAGVARCDPSLDWAEVRRQKDELVDSLRQAKYVDVLASYPEVTVLRGRARFEGDAVTVDGSPVRASRVVIATGTAPWTPPIPGLEEIEVLTSTTVMELEELPESMIVLGGSAVGVELGHVFARFGTRVTVLELLPRILAAEDEDASDELRRRLEEDGMEIHTGARVVRVERDGEQLVAIAETVSGERALRARHVLSAAGRRAVTDGLGLDVAGVALDERGFLRVDAQMRTSNPDVFAAGDVTGGPGFVYVAAAGGRVAAENALESAGRELDLDVVPRVTFTAPQVAAVGLTAAQAKERGLDVEEGRLSLAHVPRALVEHRADGWVKVVAERGSGRIVGVHAVASHAGELLGEAALAVRLGLTVQDVVDTMHPYLTWGEAMKLAAQSVTTDVSRLSCCA